MMPLRMWEFLIGFAAAYYLTNGGSVKYKNLSYIGFTGLIALIAIPFMNVDGQSLSRMLGHPSFYALGVCIATVLIIAFGLPEMVAKSFIGKIFARIGDYSYSIYLVHFPIIVLYLYQPFSGTKLYPESYFDKGVLFILIALMSILMHKFIETKRINSIGKVYLISVASLFVLTGATKVTPNVMYTQDEQNIFNGLDDRAPYRCGKLSRITSPGEISCKINNENFNKSILLVGNSHADSIKIAFKESASKAGFNTYFLVSNTPLMDNSVTPEILIGEALKKEVKHIVLHYSPKALKVEKIEKLLYLAGNRNIRVDLILPIPIYNESVPKMLFLKRVNIYDKNYYLEQNSEYFKRLYLLESKYKDFTVFEIDEQICTPDCQLSTKDGRPYYFDATHLTLTGAKKLQPVFDKML